MRSLRRLLLWLEPRGTNITLSLDLIRIQGFSKIQKKENLLVRTFWGQTTQSRPCKTRMGLRSTFPVCWLLLTCWLPNRGLKSSFFFRKHLGASSFKRVSSKKRGRILTLSHREEISTREMGPSSTWCQGLPSIWSMWMQARCKGTSRAFLKHLSKALENCMLVSCKTKTFQDKRGSLPCKDFCTQSSETYIYPKSTPTSTTRNTSMTSTSWTPPSSKWSKRLPNTS